MIVKVVDDDISEHYWLWDNIDGIEVRPIWKEDEKKQVNIDSPQIFKVIGSVIDRTKPSQGMSINFFKNNEWCSITFNTTAYICSDQGKTLEVIRG